MDTYKITGGFPVKGKLKASGNKNAALPCLTATLLTDEEVVLSNIPEIEDVFVVIEIMEYLGTKVKKLGSNKYSFKTGNLINSDIPKSFAQKIRASILFAGPLLARAGEVTMFPPGGDVIGRRRLDTHVLAMTALGARIEIDGVLKFTTNKLKGVDMFLDEASVTATENTIMVAVLSEGTTVINNAASEPHVQDLCNMLNRMGAMISGVGSNILIIEGKKRLHGCEYSIGTDFMEVGSFIGLASVTGGELEIENAGVKHLRMVRLAFNKLGIHWQEEGDSIFVPSEQNMKVSMDMGGMIPKIDDAPWPGFPPDLTSIMVVVATQVDGTVLVHEKMFESRMFFVDKLISMGAGIILCDPHRAVVSGPSKLHGAELVSPDVRAGMALVISALCAKGNSTIKNIYQIERGYENLVGKLQSVGANIIKE